MITTDGRPLVQPGLTEVADAVGLTTAPSGDFYDLVIIGGGPAGLGAAVYAASEGLRAVDRGAGRRAGGQAGQSSRIENYLGFPDGVSGGQLTERARRQAVRFGAELLTARTVVGLEAEGPGPPGDLRRRLHVLAMRSCWLPASAIGSCRRPVPTNWSAGGVLRVGRRPRPRPARATT